MLTISKPLSASQAQTYHKLDFASETQSYYRQGIAIEEPNFTIWGASPSSAVWRSRVFLRWKPIPRCIRWCRRCRRA